MPTRTVDTRSGPLLPASAHDSSTISCASRSRRRLRAGEDPGDRDAHRDVARVQQQRGDGRRERAAAGFEDRARGELRRAREDRRRHDDRCGPLLIPASPARMPNETPKRSGAGVSGRAARRPSRKREAGIPATLKGE